MKKLFCASLYLLMFLFAANSYGDFTGKGHVHTLAESKETFLNPDCRTDDTCDLKRFTLTKLAHEVWFSDDPKNPTHGNAAIMEYETGSVAAIEKYAIVQFVKGCVFLTTKSSERKIEKQINYPVSSFGESVPLCFPRWVIDSQDTDPVFNSDPEFGRFYLLRWNAPGSHDNRTQQYYGARKPSLPVVYMTDYPAGAFVTDSGVKNTSLQFKTCIYKANEVPARTVRDDVNFATPIHCFQWQNVYLFDFDKRQFDTQLKEQEAPAEPVRQPNFFVLVSFVLVILGLVSAVWLRRRFFSPNANLP
jgi:hypothetical protein